MSEPSLTWIRAAQQSRSQKTLERLLDATERLLEERSFEAISVQDIVKAAKSSIGSFYARFGDKNALIQALHQRFCADILETAKQFEPDQWAEADLQALIEAFCDLMLADIRVRPGLRRAFLMARPKDPHFQARTHAIDSHLVEILRQMMAPFESHIAHKDLDEATRFAFEMANALAEHRLLYGEHQDFGPAFRQQLVRAILGFLTQPGMGSPVA